ncbi:MAG: hypothetical protein GXP04_12175 [Alphaproteobacteria bacterium]|nr:hypothetical protein [Alphaproteobacteria bacterium]
MKTKLIFIVAAMLLGACTTVELNTEKDGLAYLTSGTPKQFETLLSTIGGDAIKLSKHSDQWGGAEYAAGLGILASAAYGGFTTTFGGSDNLRDAAFSAATIASLRTYSNPTSRRSAAAQASRRLGCLSSAASKFQGDFSPAPQSLSASLLTGASGKSWATDPGFISAFNVGTGVTTVTTLRQALIPQEIKDFGVNLQSAVDDEREVYGERFVLVGSAYRTIINTWRQATEIPLQNYEQLIKTITVAVEQKKQAETNKNNNVKAAYILQGMGLANAGIVPYAETGDRYAKAKEAVVACAAID